ncbi:tetratricopeptide repeat protein [Actinomadura parmotrematis]|uniref:Tetratricopeptide repeat protein n=1 Tax=Actinomadura parmotrematis TaxID=2864039 RepID=A0ABS7G3J3_9ACTN|nr:tetratricopeptide repeat protein [Actinomadura parmotrematis]MBW8486925.1 tetratricopeptide repeat protein [Actinomadura parmotrematis]
MSDVHDLMQRAYELPYGEPRTVLVEEALRRAEGGDRALAFRVRMELGTAYEFGGEPMKLFTTFTRALADFDAAPAEVGEGAEHQLLWQFKWIVSSLTQFPEVPLDRTLAVLDDMERRYRQGGHSLHALYGRRARVAKHLGDAAAADRWFGLWQAAPRDDLSDCAGCDPSGKAAHLYWRGRYDEALAVAGPVLLEELNCTEQPGGILTTLLPLYARTGRWDEARTAHLRAYRQYRTQLARLGDIGAHLEFCARTGNEARGLEILQRHLEWLDRAPSPSAAMDFAAPAALLLGRVDPAAELVRRPGEPTTAGALRTELAGLATSLAARFDARNGTSRQGDIVRETLAAEPWTDHLPLTGGPRRRPPAPAPAPAPVPPGVDTLDAALDLAEEHRKAEAMDAAHAAWRRYDELVAAGAEPTVLQRARRLEGTGAAHQGAGDFAEAAGAWSEGAALYETLGKAEDAATLRNLAATMRALAGDAGAEGDVRETLAWMEAHGTEPRRAAMARVRLAMLLLEGGRGAEALAVLDVPPATDDAAVRSRHLMLRAQAHLDAGDVEEAAGALRAARETAAGTVPDVAAQAPFILAQILAQTDENALDEAAALLGEALEHAPPGGPMAATAHRYRGELLLRLERPADAAPDLAEAVAAFTALGQAEDAACVRIDLAAAHHMTGRHLEAAELAEEAQLGPLEPGDDLRARLIAANAQEKLGEPGAADAFTELAALEEHPLGKGHHLRHAGEILTGADKDDAAAERFTEAARWFSEGGDPFAAVDALRRGAMCRWWSGRPDEARAQMRDARAALAGLPPDAGPALAWHTALIDYDEARLLLDDDRAAAIGNLHRAVAGFASIDEKDAASQARALLDDLTDTPHGSDGADPS